LIFAKEKARSGEAETGRMDFKIVE